MSTSANEKAGQSGEKKVKRKKRVSVFPPPPGGATDTSSKGFCPSYDSPGYLYPGPYAAGLNRKHTKNASSQSELALPSTNFIVSGLLSRLSRIEAAFFPTGNTKKTVTF